MTRLHVIFSLTVLTLAASLVTIMPTRPFGEPHPVYASSNTWSVNELGDSGTMTCAANAGAGGPVCELRDAMNKAASGDTIGFSVSGTLNLGSTLPIITKSLMIDGTGQSVTISGTGSIQFIQVNSGGTLWLNLLTISGYGGNSAIANMGTLNVTASTFGNKNATGGTYYGTSGGGITNSGILNVTTSTFTNGGNSAIANTGTLNVTASTFVNNNTTVGAYYGTSGGGITNSGILNVTTSTFANNTALGGGAIENSGTLNIIGSTFFNNGAVSHLICHVCLVNTNGGAIENTGTLNIANSTFSPATPPAESAAQFTILGRSPTPTAHFRAIVAMSIMTPTARGYSITAS
jgi:hypothetical protein